MHMASSRMLWRVGATATAFLVSSYVVWKYMSIKEIRPRCDNDDDDDEKGRDIKNGKEDGDRFRRACAFVRTRDDLDQDKVRTKTCRWYPIFLPEITTSMLPSLRKSIQQLLLYGLFKQATKGPCTTSRPYSIDVVACAKWDSWSKHGSKSRSEAVDEYVALVRELGWSPHSASPVLTEKETTKKKKKTRKAGMGLAVSTMAIGDMKRLEQENSHKKDDVFTYCGKGDVDKVKDLIRHGADVNGVDDQKMTLLHWASDRGHFDLVKLLIERGANVDAQDAYGSTPFAMAVTCEHDDIALYLAHDAGADCSIKDADGESPASLLSDNLRKKLEDIGIAL